MVMQRLVALGFAVCVALLLTPAVVAAQCTGCEGDLDGDDSVTISELVTAVGNALNGCGDRVTCTTDDDCDPDEVCTEGTCTGVPDPCETDDDCDSDEQCLDGNCV
jgi:hypothetical protein